MVTVVGAGFAGVEAAWGLAERGIEVELFEMRPVRRTPAHTTDFFAELVCSNSHQICATYFTRWAAQVRNECVGFFGSANR